MEPNKKLMNAVSRTKLDGRPGWLVVGWLVGRLIDLSAGVREVRARTSLAASSGSGGGSGSGHGHGHGHERAGGMDTAGALRCCCCCSLGAQTYQGRQATLTADPVVGGLLGGTQRE